MGWKSVKDHYQIGHIVCNCDEGIAIGSSYIPKLIVIGVDGTFSTKSDLAGNSDLERYRIEMLSDMDKLLELVRQEDSFERSIPVWTYDGSEIIEKHCEELGFPNVTHDGWVMYDNMYFGTFEEAHSAALKNAEGWHEYSKERVLDCQRLLEDSRQGLALWDEALCILRKGVVTTDA